MTRTTVPLGPHLIITAGWKECVADIRLCYNLVIDQGPSFNMSRPAPDPYGIDLQQELVPGYYRSAKFDFIQREQIGGGVLMFFACLKAVSYTHLTLPTILRV